MKDRSQEALIDEREWRAGRQRLFDLLQQEHGITPLQSELGDIEQCVAIYMTTEDLDEQTDMFAG